MSAKVLTKAAAKEAGIELIEDGKGSQAVHDTVVAMRAARRSGSANTKTKAEVDFLARNLGDRKGPVARELVTNLRRSGVAVASSLDPSHVTIQKKFPNPCDVWPFERR